MAIVGIDLGTTFSAIAVLDDIGNPEVLPSLDNNRVTPSIVYISTDNKIIVGDKAKSAGIGDPTRVIKEVKKEMGSDRVFDIKKGDWVDGKQDLKNTYSPEYISACILKKLKNYTQDVKQVVITVPALFSDPSKKATQDAAKDAGLEVLELIHEPTAAILHYSNIPGVSLSGKILVFDLGGGTFDVTIADVQGKNIDVITSQGDGNLGGTDFDKEIFNLLSEKYKKEKGNSLDENAQYLEVAEKIKRILSVKDNTSEVIDGPDGPLEIKITRDEYIKSIGSYLDRIKMLLDACLDGKKLQPSDITETLLVGGSTRTPIITELVTKKMKKPPVKGVNVDEAVASGAAIYAGLLSKDRLNAAQKKAIEDIELQEITNYYLGTMALTINDATQQYEEYNSIIIHRDSKTPCTETQDYYTVRPDQKAIDIKVTQSNTEESDMNFVDIIGEYTLELPPGTPEGDRIDTTYSYDKSGIMHCKSVHSSSGNTNSTDVSIKSGTDKKNDNDDDPFLNFDFED